MIGQKVEKLAFLSSSCNSVYEARICCYFSFVTYTLQENASTKFLIRPNFSFLHSHRTNKHTNGQSNHSTLAVCMPEYG